jgi:hypothetical protein
MDPEIIVQLILSNSWLVLTALIVGGIVRAAKAGWWPKKLKIEPRDRELAVMALGVLSGILETLAKGTPSKEALARGLVAGVIAIVGHRIGIDWLRGGRELFAPKETS